MQNLKSVGEKKKNFYFYCKLQTHHYPTFFFFSTLSTIKNSEAERIGSYINNSNIAPLATV